MANKYIFRKYVWFDKKFSRYLKHIYDFSIFLWSLWAREVLMRPYRSGGVCAPKNRIKSQLIKFLSHKSDNKKFLGFIQYE